MGCLGAAWWQRGKDTALKLSPHPNTIPSVAPYLLSWLGTSTHQHPSPALWSTPSKEGESSKDASTPESTGTLAFSTLESTIHREAGLKVSFR